MYREIFCLKAHHLHLGKSDLTTTMPLSTTLQRLSLPTFFSDETRCLAPTSMIFFRSGHRLFLRIRIPLLRARMRCIMPSTTLIWEMHLGSVSPSSTMVRSKKVTQPRGSINPSRSGIVILGLSCTTSWETGSTRMKWTLHQRTCAIKMTNDGIQILCLEIGRGDKQYVKMVDKSPV